MKSNLLNKITAVLAVAILALFTFQARAFGATDTDPDKNIVEIAIDGKFNTLVAAVKAAGLVEVLQGEGPFTVFAPTDEAFAKLPEGTLENLLKPENKDQLIAILTYHVVPGKVTSGQVVKLKEAGTVQGSPLSINVHDGMVMVNKATVTAVDIEATNGVVHVIDTVLLPPAGK